MYTSIYTGMTGLVAYSNGLDVLGNNVSNMNTTGFKASDLTFHDLYYRSSGADADLDDDPEQQQFGSGVGEGQTSLRTAQGDIRETGNDLDVAIDGEGFFVLRDGESQYLTRAGRFSISEDGYLVRAEGGERVAGLEDGRLVDISVDDVRTDAPSPTTEIGFVNNLSSGGSQHVVDDVAIFDATGQQRGLEFTFTNNSSSQAGSWLIDVATADGTSVATDGEVRFNPDGSPMEGFNTFTFTYSEGAGSPTEITLDLGEPDTFTGATSFASGSSSDLEVDTINGNGPGTLSATTFTEDGALQLTYSNGVERQSTQLALARVPDINALNQLSDSRFRLSDNAGMVLDTPNASTGATIRSGSLELSNVELSREFSELVVLQRGYQASSKILSVADEMLQQLINGGQGGR